MSTDTNSRSEHRARHHHHDLETSQDAPKAKKKNRSWRLTLFLVGLAVIVWLLPGIVAHTPLLRWGLGMATADLNGTVTIQSASLGWLSPIVVNGIEVKDAKSQSVLSVYSVEGDRTLAQILFNYTKLGKFSLRGMKLSVAVNDKGSNVEDLLAKYLEPKEEESSSNIGLAVEIIDGKLSITDQITGQSWQAEKLTLGLDMSEGASGPMEIKFATDLLNAQNPAKLGALVKMASGSGEAKLSIAKLPMAIFRAPAARFMPGTKLTGTLSSEIKASWGDKGAGKNTLEADLTTQSLALSSTSLQSDVLLLEQLRTVCKASWQADRVDIETASIDCDLGHAMLTGTIPLDQKKGFSIDSLLRQRQDLRGELNLAQLARLLPATLCLRPGMQINSGMIQMAMASKPEQQGTSWQGRVEAANITANYNGRQLTWKKPILVTLAAHETAGKQIVDELKCESDFLKFHGKGATDDLNASLSFNLKQLADELGQFVDFGKLQFAGDGWGNFNWKRSPEQFEADGDLNLRGFEWSMLGQPAWREENVTATFAAKGQTDFSENTRLDAASVNVKTATAANQIIDQIDANLSQPVANLKNGGVWPVVLEMKGQLQNWPVRLAAWLPQKGWNMAGAYAMKASCTASKDNVELRQMRFVAQPLIVSPPPASPWLFINEPQVDASFANGKWNQQNQCLQLASANLTCATVAVQAENVIVALPEKGPMELSGTMKYKGDLARLRQWVRNPATPAMWNVAGFLTGTAQVRQKAGVMRGETMAEVVRLAVIDSSNQQFQEPKVMLSAVGNYDTSTKLLLLEQFQLTSTALTAGAKGRVQPVSGRNEAQIDGQIGYDLERLSGLLRPYLGPGIRATGRGTSTAWYKGPLSLASSRAAANVKWDGVNSYGLLWGPGELKAEMADGTVQIAPINLAVNQGQLHLAPCVRLASNPMEVDLPKGSLVERVEINPAMCDSMLKYAAPAIAQVATARGTFSIDLDRCRIPLTDAKKGDLSGRIILHSVEIGTGPMLHEMAVLLGRDVPARLKQESVVAFRMENGRVYHDKMELQFPDMTIRTTGSVGLVDDSLDIMAEMTVPPKWLVNNTTLNQAMRNQLIRLPIRGTLGKPKIDQRAMEQESAKFIRKAAGNILESEINKGLDQLFKQGK